MPAPLPVASPPDDGIIVEFSVGDVTLAPVGRNVRVDLPGMSCVISSDFFTTIMREGLRHHDR